MRPGPRDVPLLPPPPRALSLRNKAGSRYERLAAVEAEIDDLLRLAAHGALTARIRERDRESPAHVREESVAYFLREWHREGHADARDWLVDETLRRIDRFIAAHLHGLDAVDAELARDDVIEALFRALLDLGAPGGEFYQVRFWRALNTRCIDRYNFYERREAGERRAEPVPTAPEGSDPLDALEDGSARVAEGVVDRDAVAWVRRQLDGRVTDDQWEAYVLRRVHGWPIEGDAGLSISGRFKVTPRTVNNWIRAVDAAAAPLRGGRHGR